MIGQLPKELNVNGKKLAIRSDFRVVLLIFQAYGDPDLSDDEKATVMMECLYENPEDIKSDNYQTAAEQAIWFLDGGGTSGKDVSQANTKKIIDWEQDEQLIFSAVNKVAGYETRSTEYLHWWTFLGFFNEIGEGLFSTVINIRSKKNKGKKLEKHEQEFYKENKSLIDLNRKLSTEEQEERERINQWLNS